MSSNPNSYISFDAYSKPLKKPKTLNLKGVDMELPTSSMQLSLSTMRLPTTSLQLPTQEMVLQKRDYTDAQKTYYYRKKREYEAQQRLYEEWLRKQRLRKRAASPAAAKARRLANTSNARQLNSLADVVGTILGGARYDNESSVATWLFNNWGENPITNIVAGVANLFSSTKEFIIDPALQGDFSAVALNLAQGGIETLDILANPIKGLVMDGPEGFVKGMGWGEEGRTTYEFDTGNFAGNLIAELACDPGVWASFGVSGFLKGAAKGAGKAALEEAATTYVSKTTSKFVQEVVSESGEKATRQWLSRASAKTIKALSRGDNVTVDMVVKSLVKTAPVHKIVHPLTTKLAKESVEKIAPDAVQELSEAILRISKKQATELSENLAYRVIKAIDTVDNTVTKTVFSPIWLPFKGVKVLRNLQNSRVLKILEPYIANKGTLDIMDFETVMAKTGEVNESLVNLAEEQGLKGFSNSEIQKAFYRAGTEDINQLKKLSQGLSKKTPDFGAYDLNLRIYLEQTHGFSSDLSTKEMLVELARHYKKAGQASPMFVGLHQNITNIINTYDAIVQAKPYYELLNKDAAISGAVTKLSESFKEVSLKDLEVYVKEHGGTLEEARAKLTENSKLLDSNKLLNVMDEAQKAYSLSYKKAANNILQIIKGVDPELFELAKHSAPHRDLLEKLAISVRTYLSQGSGAEHAKRYLEHFLPTGTTLENIVPEYIFKKSAVMVGYTEERLLDAVTKAYGFTKRSELVRYLKTSLDEPISIVVDGVKYADFEEYFSKAKSIKNPNINATIYDLPKELAVQYFTKQEAEVLDKLTKHIKSYAKRLVALSSESSARILFTDSATDLNALYKDSIRQLSDISDEFASYTQNVLTESKTLSDKIENIYSLGTNILKAG